MLYTKLLHMTISGTALALSTMLLATCQSLVDLAPLVAADDAQFARLSAGRDVYITSCTKCHSPEPVAKYTAGEWRDILDRMYDKVTLSMNERESLEAYIRAFAQASQPKP